MPQKPTRAAVEEALRLLGLDPSQELITWVLEHNPTMLDDQAGQTTGRQTAATETDLLRALRDAHQDADVYTALLAAAREKRRMLAVLLRKRGRTYRWIGDQLGITRQAVEGFVKYSQRRRRGPQTTDTRSQRTDRRREQAS